MSGVRSGPGRARVMPRELILLDLIHQVGTVSTAHAVRLLQVKGHIARRSLRKLEQLELIKRHRPSLNEPAWFTLHRKQGPAILSRVYGYDLSDIRVVGGIGRMNLPHHGGMVDFLVDLKIATVKSKSVGLERFYAESELRARLPRGARGALVPDGIAVLSTAVGRVALALEVDLATENPSYVADRKGLAYAHRRAAGEGLAGCGQWCVAIVVPHERRARSIQRAMWNRDLPGQLFFFAIADHLNASNVLTASPWRTLHVNESGTGHMQARAPHKVGQSKTKKPSCDEDLSTANLVQPMCQVGVAVSDRIPESS